MNNLNLYIKLLKPLKVERINSVYILYTMDGDYVLKKSKCDYKKLYSYLNSRGFKNYPELFDSTRNDCYLFKYEKDLEIDNNQKIKDIFNTVSILHNKTSYFKDVTSIIYNNIYDDINSNLEYLNNKFKYFFDNDINNRVLIPSRYLFLRFYSLFYFSIIESKKYLDKWFDMVKSNNKERVCLIHNNLKLEHYIKNDNDYLISWDKYKFDTPVLDIYEFYKNTYLNGNIVDNMDIYLEKYPWNESEKLLFCSLITIPFDISFDTNEIDLCREIRKNIIYLNKSYELVTKMAIEV